MNKRTRLRTMWAALLVAVVAASFSDVGAAADPNGTVNADVTVAAAAACIELSATSVSFGTLPLGAVAQSGTPGITVTNCSTSGSEALLASGTNATNAATTWTLDGSQAGCLTLAPDRYHLDLQSAMLTQPFRLSTLPQSVLNLGAGQGFSHSIAISTACPGSSGAGQQLNMQVNYTATA